MNWDWYSATLPAGPDEVLPVLVRAEDLASIEPIRGMHSYETGVEVRRGPRVFCRAFWGGVNGDDVHVQASGRDAPRVVQAVRDGFPEHRVSRADACEDFTAPGAWDLLSAMCIEVAKDHGVKVRHHGDWLRAVDGRTLYLGGAASLVQVRCYEKGKQLSADPNWVRVEVQVRPKGQGKDRLATAQPGELLGTSFWTSELGQRLGMPEVQRITIRDPWQQSDDERALYWAVRQYGEVFERKAMELGSFEALGVWLSQELQRMRNPQ